MQSTSSGVIQHKLNFGVLIGSFLEGGADFFYNDDIVRVLGLLCLWILVLGASDTYSIREAMGLYSAGKRTEALQMLGQIVKSEPANFEAHYRLGLLALDSNDLQTAVASLEEASRLRPDQAAVWLALAQTYLKLEKPKLAVKAASKAESIAPNDPLILHGLALFHSEKGDLSKAALFETRYAVKAPADRQAIPRAIQFYLQAGQPKPAIELVLKGLSTENRADLHNLLGKAYEADGQYDKSVNELQEAIKLNPREESYYFDLGYVLLLHQNFDVAIRLLEPATKIFEKSAQLMLTLGIAYYGQRKFPEAVDAFLRTAELAPQVEQPYVFLARIIDHAEGRLPEVTEKFSAFSKSNPQNYLGYFLHAKGLIAQMGPSGSSKPAEEAEALLRRSIALNSQYWEAQYELGLLLEQKKDFASAAQHLERSTKLNPKSPTPHYRLARIYDRLGKHELAEAERSLHEKLSAEERVAIEKHAAGLKRLELVVK